MIICGTWFMLEPQEDKYQWMLKCSGARRHDSRLCLIKYQKKDCNHLLKAKEIMLVHGERLKVHG